MAPYFARVVEGGEKIKAREEFVLHRGVFCRRWRETMENYYKWLLLLSSGRHLHG